MKQERGLTKKKSYITEADIMCCDTVGLEILLQNETTAYYNQSDRLLDLHKTM